MSWTLQLESRSALLSLLSLLMESCLLTPASDLEAGVLGELEAASPLEVTSLSPLEVELVLDLSEAGPEADWRQLVSRSALSGIFLRGLGHSYRFLGT